MKFTLVIPTYNAGDRWKECLKAIDMQTCQPDSKLVIDSQSTDSTLALATQAGFETQVIDKAEFNHGGTRMQALQMCQGSDVVVYLTQDAILVDDSGLQNILDHFTDAKVAAVCGRQLPHRDAGAIEAHARIYNYQESSDIRSLEDRSRYGLKTAFLSNSFAAYRVAALEEVGGFPRDVIFGEDMYAATRLLKAGYSIAYAADACVYHSHSYTVLQEFRRYFDMGVFHAREPWIRQSLGGAESEGVRFVRSEVAYLLKFAPWLIPEGVFRTLCRYAGFRFGQAERLLPVRLKQQLVMNKSYFIKKT